MSFYRAAVKRLSRLGDRSGPRSYPVIAGQAASALPVARSASFPRGGESGCECRPCPERSPSRRPKKLRSLIGGKVLDGGEDISDHERLPPANAARKSITTAFSRGSLPGDRFAFMEARFSSPKNGDEKKRWKKYIPIVFKPRHSDYSRRRGRIRPFPYPERRPTWLTPPYARLILLRLVSAIAKCGIRPVLIL